MLYSFKEITDEQMGLLGGKGASLVKLTRAGLPVPEGYVLTYGSDASEVQKILPGLKGTYAVRSSALNEDGAKASFAGAYETITDVKVEDIEEAVKKVQRSAESLRVEAYAREQGVQKDGISVVIQRFVKPEFAGVIFTSDVLTGSSESMIGNYVKGEGELLVSGSANAEEFRFNTIKYSYDGPAEFKPYAKKLFGYCSRIRDLWGMPMDIEWAVSEGKVYILQARPVTTLIGRDMDTYLINDSMSDDYLLTRTNVGEIFMKPLSPATMDMMQKICDALGMPRFISIIYGQAYLNISAVCSVIVAYGVSREKAFKMIKDIAGNVPEGTRVPVSPVSRKAFTKQILHLIKPKKKDKSMGLAASPRIREQLSKISSNKELYDMWDSTITPFINSSLGEIAKGANIVNLFGTREKIVKVCGEELTERLLTGSVGLLDSMKPLLSLEDLMDGRISREEYIKICGHRHVNEMELMCPYPYEEPEAIDRAMEEHRRSGISVRKMKEEQEAKFGEAFEEFKSKYPGKVNWLRKKLDKYGRSNRSREHVRSEGVKIFCILRGYLLRASELTGMGDDIFMLTIDETLALLGGKTELAKLAKVRRETYEKYLTYPQFPNLICGRFDPDKWVEDPNRRNDFYMFGEESLATGSGSVKGFPGAAGVVTGTVRVISDIDKKDELKEGEILVTTATNIGWTMIFPRAAAVVTDIGAPLSHAAIVAREFGIPAVVGCGNATTVLKTGDIVTVDGLNGTVTKI